jgi:hypothetical protein
VVPLLSSVALALFWLGLLRRPRHVLARLRGRRTAQASLAVAHAALAFTLYDLQGYPDRFFLEPFMAVAVGLLLARTLRFRPAAFLLPALGLALAVCTHALTEKRTALPMQMRKAAEVKRLHESGLSVYVVRGMHLLAFNRMSNFHPIGAFHRGVDDYIRDKTGSRHFRPESNGELPEVIVIEGDVPACLEEVMREYEATATVGSAEFFRLRRGPTPQR